jgi:hypothetical protein
MYENRKQPLLARLNFLSVLRDIGWRDSEFWLLDLAAAFSAIIALPVWAGSIPEPFRQ